LIYTLIEVVATLVLGLLFLFVGFAFIGGNKTYFNTRMPNILTEICTFADLAHPLVHCGSWAKKLADKSKWALFGVYYGM